MNTLRRARLDYIFKNDPGTMGDYCSLGLERYAEAHPAFVNLDLL